MTTIIISLLAALGIGGGVMLASGGGSSDSGGAAIVSNVNPGGSGSSSTSGTTTAGSNTGGSNTGGSSTGGTTTGSGSSTGGSTGGGTTGYSNVGALLARGSLNGISVVGKGAQGNTTLSGKNLSIGLSVYSPILVSGTTYRSNEEYDTMNTSDGSHKILAGHEVGSPLIKEIVNLNTIDVSNAYADFYAGSGFQTKNLGTLNLTYLKNRNAIYNKTFTDVTWTFNIMDFALGARKFGLQNSEFGYYVWHATYSSVDIDKDKSLRDKVLNNYGGQPFYMFDTSKQITNYAKYGQAATFTGHVIGFQRFENYVCRTDSASIHITADISLSLNLANKTLSGDITNTKLYSYPHSGSSTTGVYHTIVSSTNTGSDWYNFALSGTINDVSSGSPNITFTDVTYDLNSAPTTGRQYDGYPLHPLNNSDNFGDAVIVQSNTNKDEMVGKIAFTGHNPQTSVYYFYDTFLTFGAKQK